MNDERSRTRQAVVCGTDFTQHARDAADVAARLAVALGRPLLLVHGSADAAAGPGTGAAAKAAVKAAVAARRDALKAEAVRLRTTGATVVDELHGGHADDVLIERAGACDATMIVLGSLGTRSAPRHRLGSIAERTAEAAPVPTLVVRRADALLAWLRGDAPLGVFLGFDYTVPAEAAITWVRELRRAGPCRVTVAYANWPDERERLGFPRNPSAPRNPEPVQDALERSLRARVSALVGDDARVIVQAARGRADLALLEMASEAQADLIVTGTHQQKGIGRLLYPSVSRGLLQAALVSVVTVPAVQALKRVPPVPVLRRVLVATDFSPLAARAIAHAFAVAEPGGVVQVVHVCHPLALAGGEFETGIGPSARHASYVRACERKLRALVPEEAPALGIGAEVAVVEDEEPAAAICRQAERFGADVIVLGSQGRSALARVMLGSVAQSVMASSKRPVFVVRAPRN